MPKFTACLMLWVGLNLMGCGGLRPATTPDAARQAAGRVPAYAIAQANALPPRLDIPLQRSGGYLLVPAYINGEAADLMMIDTGASLSVVAQGVAGRLNLPTDGRGRTLGVGGFEDFDFYRTDSFSIGRPPETAANQSPRQGVLRLNRPKAAGLRLLGFGRSLGVTLGGIVAFTDFGEAPFTLDAANRTLSVYRPDSFRPPAGASRHRLRNFRRLPLVRAELDHGHERVEVWLIIDYGANNTLTLPRAVLDRHPGVVAVNAAGRGRTRGVGGTVTSTQTWVKNFRFLGLELENVPVSFETPPPTMRGEKLIGRIGNDLLQSFRLTFHPAHGWLYAQWTPEAGP